MIFNYADTSEEHLNAHINRLIDIMDEIHPNQVTILTGGNALGKSLIRKQLMFRIHDQLDAMGVENDVRHLIASASMQLRTENRPEWGALSTMAHDTPWSSTSESTIGLINKLFQHREEKRYYVIDEMEVGMSREVQLGMAQYLDERMPELLGCSHGILIITHSADVVRTIKHDKFINIEGLTEEEWLNREVEPIPPDLIIEWSNKLFRAIENRMKKVDK